MATAYYNEIDPFAAAWLRELIARDVIAPGIVDERSIEDVCPDELAGFTQCHFFAGIGVHSYALRRAGWADDRPIWTGSCPCQPFSAAGQGKGFADERHLWPAFFHLISERRPPIVAGEQVASKDGLTWIDLVSTDLEGEGYAFGAADLCAAGVGAPPMTSTISTRRLAPAVCGRSTIRKPKPMTKPNEPEGLCALCGHARHRHGSGYPATCPIIPTYRAPTQPVADAGGVTEDDVIGLINIVTDLAEVDALDKAYPEVWGRLEAMVNHAVAAATAAKDAEIARLRSVIRSVADGIERGEDCWQRLYETMCCNGDDCGCMASSWAQLTVHDLRAALSEAREAGAKD